MINKCAYADPKGEKAAICDRRRTNEKGKEEKRSKTITEKNKIRRENNVLQ